MVESTSRSRNGNGTSPASPALDAPCRWWVPASSPSKMRSSVATATATYRTQPPSTHLTSIHSHTSLFYTAVPSPENFLSQFKPMLILLFEITANQQHTIVSASPKYSKNRFAGLRPDKTKLLKDAPKIAVETWKPCNVESLLIQNQHYINIVGLYAHIKNIWSAY